MCGRYDLDADIGELVARFGVPLREVSVNLKVTSGMPAAESTVWHAKYNIAPRQQNPVVLKAGGGRSGSNSDSGASGQKRIELMQWGLVPSWSKGAKVGYSTINARAETVASKPSFRKAFATRRCLVPATGYFEWAEGLIDPDVNIGGRGGRHKQAYTIRLQADGDRVDGIFAFAGLYDIWCGPGGEELKTYTIVTTRATDGLSAIHSRMPVILPRDVEELWLEGENGDVDRLISLLQPYSEEELTTYPVSSLVNSPANEGRRLIEPLGRLAA